MYTYNPENVCSKEINFEIKDGKIYNVSFVGGCSGNLQGISKLIEGMSIKEAIKRLDGIDCGGKGTSCPDQFSRALKSLNIV